VITHNGEAKAVLLDTESYQEMLTTMVVLKLIASREKEIADGKMLKSDRVFRELRNSLTNT